MIPRHGSAPDGAPLTRSGASARPRRRSLALLVLMALVAAHGVTSSVLAHAESASSFRVIVNSENPEAYASREWVTNAFLKKTTRWPRGEAIHPVDLRFGSTVREAFSKSILERSAAAVRNYWQQRIFTGRGVPPPEAPTDADVLRYVREHPGGIGYVSPQADAASVKVLPIR